jgi:6,7-dimethyl-8-ribityllumazine synthase
MSTALKNLSSYDPQAVPPAENMSFGLVVAEWNHEITEALFQGAYSTLLRHKASPQNIHRINVPGSFELPSGAQFFAEYKKVDAVICIGCVIQGETRHFDFICSAVSHGLISLGIKYNKPFIFGVLTPDTQQQALDRAGGKHGNKGDEAAITAIKMVHLQKEIAGKTSF